MGPAAWAACAVLIVVLVVLSAILLSWAKARRAAPVILAGSEPANLAEETGGSLEERAALVQKGPWRSFILLSARSVTGSTGVCAANNTGDPVASVDTPFRIGSITKLLTAALVLKLGEAGAWGLDEPVSRLGLRFEDPRGAAVTLRHLLEHRSGLPRMPRTHPADAEYPTATAVFLSHVASEQFLTAPGAATEYSNLGFIALGAAIEKATGGKWAAALREHVTAPLGMRSTGTEAEGHRAEPLYDALADETLLRLENDYEPWFASSSGGLISTAADLHRFATGLGKLLSPEALTVFVASLDPLPRVLRIPGEVRWLKTGHLAGGRSHLLMPAPGEDGKVEVYLSNISLGVTEWHAEQRRHAN